MNFNGFKARYGEQTGDAVLRALPHAILGTIRLPAFLAQSDVDTFAMILENESLPDVQVGIGRLLKELPRHRIPFRGSLFQVRIRIGLAEVLAGECAADLMTRAVAALNAAQNRGRDLGCIHDGTQCLPLDPLFAEDERRQADCPVERRSCPRYPFEYVQLVGPHNEGNWPSLDELHPVTCHDISATGFSYRSAEPPQHKSIVLVLGFAAQRKHMLARIVRCQPLPGGERVLYHVGCQFVGRLQ